MTNKEQYLGGGRGAASGHLSGKNAERGLFVASVLGALAAIGFGLTAVPAEAGTRDGAEKLRRLDIMLMVTGLRCRKTADDFQADYGQFTRRQMPTLNQANNELRNQLAAQSGTQGAARALDRMSVVMANEYGNGHPWLNCGELRQVTKSLAMVQGRETLEEAADQLLQRQPTALLALAH